jgi:hypothetical protein
MPPDETPGVDVPPVTRARTPRWWGYQDRATGELFAYGTKRLPDVPKTVILLRWRELPAFLQRTPSAEVMDE